MAAIEKVEAEKVGGEENYKILKKIYASDEFKTQQKQGLEAGLAQIKGEKAPDPTNNNEPIKPKTLDTDTITAVTEGVSIDGNEAADVLLIEYSDIECPFCKKHHDNGTVAQVLKNFPDDVKTTFKNFPLGFHKQAQHNAEAIECAKDQADGKTVTAFIGALFASSDLTSEGTIAAAKTAGLDADTIKTCMDSGEKTDLVKAQMSEAQTLFNVNGTPGNVLLNTKTGEYKVVSGAQPYPAFEQAINELLGK